MLNIIPALLIFLSSASFGQSSGDVYARQEAIRQYSVAVRLVDELKRAGLSAAQAVLVVGQYQDESELVPTKKLTVPKIVWPVEPCLRDGFSDSGRTRDGPRSKQA